MRPFRLCIAFPALAFLLVAQPTQYAKYPSAIATDTDLLLLNVGSTTLASFVDASATSLTFVGTNPFAAPLAVQIGSELVFCSGSNGNGLTGCTRGWKGTKAASHGATAAVMSWYNDTVGSLKLLNLIGLGKLPLCIGTDGTITAGTNTGGVLACP